MKKSLLALAVLGAFATAAQAQTNVTIGGVIAAQVANYKISNSTRVVENEFRVDDNYNSRFWLTGTEDLGGGLSALFYIENRLNADQQETGVTATRATGNGLANGDTFLGLKGGFGQVTVGKHTLMAAQGLVTEVLTGNNTIAAMPSGAFGTYSVLNQTGAGYLDGGTRRNNSIVYRLPNLNGFTGTVGIAAAGGNGNEGQLGTTAVASAATGAITTTTQGRNYSDGREYFLQGGYANGPLYLNLAYWDVEGEGRGFGTTSTFNPVTGATTAGVATAVDIQQLRFSGSYKFGGFKVGLQVDRAEVQAVVAGANLGPEISRTAWMIPASYAFGNNTIFASYTQAGDRSGTANSGAKMYTLGYDYALSKRTNVGVFYSRLDNEVNGAYAPFLAGTTFTGTAPVAGETATTFSLGVKHTF